MAFKKIKKQSEEDFLNNARGDINNSPQKASLSSDKEKLKPFVKNKVKRKNRISFYVSEEENEELRIKAEEAKMNINQYIRIKVFTQTKIKD